MDDFKSGRNLKNTANQLVDLDKKKKAYSAPMILSRERLESIASGCAKSDSFSCGSKAVATGGTIISS